MSSCVCGPVVHVVQLWVLSSCACGPVVGVVQLWVWSSCACGSVVGMSSCGGGPLVGMSNCGCGPVVGVVQQRVWSSCGCGLVMGMVQWWVCPAVDIVQLRVVIQLQMQSVYVPPTHVYCTTEGYDEPAPPRYWTPHDHTHWTQHPTRTSKWWENSHLIYQTTNS